MTKRISRIIFILALLLSLLGCKKSNLVRLKHKANQNIYYVSPHGNDKAEGKSINNPLKTIKHAVNIAKNGGLIRILPGNYKEQIKIDDAGNRSRLRITGFKGRPVISGDRKINLGFWITNSKNVIIENLEIRNYTDIGAGAEKSKNIVFRNLVVHDNGFDAQLTDWEIEGYGIDIDEINGYQIEKNNVYNNGPKPKKYPDKLLGTGIDTFGSKNGVIKNNKSYKNVGGGILVEDSKNITVEKNDIFKNDLDATRDGWWDGGIWLDGGKNVSIINNNFYNNIGPGILISDEDRQKPTGYIIKNNKSMNNYFGIYIWNFGVNSLPKKSIISISNNNFSGNKVKNIIIHDWDYDPKTLKKYKK